MAMLDLSLCISNEPKVAILNLCYSINQDGFYFKGVILGSDNRSRDIIVCMLSVSSLLAKSIFSHQETMNTKAPQNATQQRP